MKGKSVGFLIFLIIVIIIGLNSVFILNMTEQAIITQFGEPIGDKYVDAGIQFKVPFIQKVIKFDKRVLEWDGSPQEIPTKDNKYIFIDTFARWKITDPLKFYKAVKTENTAHSRLDDLLDGHVRDEVASRTMPEIVKSTDRKMNIIEFGDANETNIANESRDKFVDGARTQITENVLAQVQKKLNELELGISVVDFRFKRINYNKDVQKKVFDRMISEQRRIAEKYRAIGQGEKQRIIGKTNQKIKEIMSGAYKTAQETKGNADAKALNIYATAYNKSTDSREFYAFLRTLTAYEKAIDSNTSLILSTDNEFFKYLNSSK